MVVKFKVECSDCVGVCICLFRGFKKVDSETHKFLTEGAQEGFRLEPLSY